MEFTSFVKEQMRMNSRNVFRLWIIGTALFVISVAFLGYRDVQKEFDELAILRELKGETVVPVLCGEARGIAGEDYTNNQEVCWYAISRFRVLYPEHNEQSDEALARKLYAARGVDLHFPPPPNAPSRPFSPKSDPRRTRTTGC
jgi:hypothetical protein